MNKQDKKEVRNLVIEAMEEVILPAMDSMEKRIRKDMATKDDLTKLEQKLREDLASKEDIARLERKFDAQQSRLDKHDSRLKVLENSAQFASL